jgi:hypothetical protein
LFCIGPPDHTISIDRYFENHIDDDEFNRLCLLVAAIIALKKANPAPETDKFEIIIVTSTLACL